MKTKVKIKDKALELFNSKGFKNVTLREVAKALSISYGNVTYHYKTKNALILSLYLDMLEETELVIHTFESENLFVGLLEAPKHTFKISLKYLFLYVDFVEIKRSYIDIANLLEEGIAKRKKGYIQILKQLQVEGVLRKELTDDDFDYLMDLSGAVRTFYFINLSPSSFLNTDLESDYVSYVNNLIYPYLTPEGVKSYRCYLKSKRR